MNHLTEREIRAFMIALQPLQLQVIDKYGNKALAQWRQQRLRRISASFEHCPVLVEQQLAVDFMRR